jgi:hypothetical protein
MFNWYPIYWVESRRVTNIQSTRSWSSFLRNVDHCSNTVTWKSPVTSYSSVPHGSERHAGLEECIITPS